MIESPSFRSRLPAITFCAILAAVATSAPLAAQSSQAWEVPRTEYGQPDLQGNWSNATLTPFERRQGQPAVLSAEEAAAIEAGQADLVAESSQSSDPDRPPPEAGGTFVVCIDSATGCYNEVYRAPGDRVAVVNGEYRSSIVTFPEDGRVPPITDQARERIRADNALRAGFGQYDHPELRPLAERCIMSFGSSAGPPMLPNYWYNNNYTIVQNEDHVLIMAEMVHDSRIIQLGDGPRLPENIRPWMGDSWGHWEGDTLVVETTNFHPEQRYRGYSSETLRIVERFTRVSEDEMLYEFTIDDPETYTEAWGGQLPFNRLEEQVYEYACHEGNYALENVLSGARYEERIDAEAVSEAADPSEPR